LIIPEYWFAVPLPGASH